MVWMSSALASGMTSPVSISMTELFCFTMRLLKMFSTAESKSCGNSALKSKCLEMEALDQAGFLISFSGVGFQEMVDLMCFW